MWNQKGAPTTDATAVINHPGSIGQCTTLPRNQTNSVLVRVAA
jgi:hypothetical protein